jgi:hypothetical protein
MKLCVSFVDQGKAEFLTGGDGVAVTGSYRGKISDSFDKIPNRTHSMGLKQAILR